MSFVKASIFAFILAHGFPAIPDAPKPPPVQQTGAATTYGLGGLHGDTMANGKPFQPHKRATCAHKSIPLGTLVMVESTSRVRMWCRVTDRGPYVVETSDGRTKAVGHHYEPTEGEQWVRVLDMSVRASRQLGEWGLFDVRVRYHRGVERVGRFASIGGRYE